VVVAFVVVVVVVAVAAAVAAAVVVVGPFGWEEVASTPAVEEEDRVVVVDVAVVGQSFASTGSVLRHHVKSLAAAVVAVVVEMDGRLSTLASDSLQMMRTMPCGGSGDGVRIATMQSKHRHCYWQERGCWSLRLMSCCAVECWNSRQQ
jgi:hypothetical protein